MSPPLKSFPVARLAMLIAGEVGLDIEMRGSPVPALRDDAGPAKPDAGIGVDTGQQRSEFGCDADAGSTLENAWLDHVFEERSGGGEAARAAGRQRCLDLALQNRFPTFGEAVVVDYLRRN